MKNDEQNENFRLRMQKTMSDVVFEIQNTKYKIQSTKYKDNDDIRYLPYIKIKRNAYLFYRNTYLFYRNTYLFYYFNSYLFLYTAN